jgi:hypothetical protein
VSTTVPARRPDRESGDPESFVLYVEGPRDRSILRAWASRLMPDRAPALLADTVILGGRRPARALEHFRARPGSARGLCLLDRDEEGEQPAATDDGLEFFTWGRRHIESYLLVPAAIQRALSLAPGDRRVETALDGGIPADEDAAGWRALDAKRLLGDRGPLATALGRPLPLARIARATREDELHEDVHRVFEQLRRELARVAPSRLRPRRRRGR